MSKPSLIVFTEKDCEEYLNKRPNQKVKSDEYDCNVADINPKIAQSMLMLSAGNRKTDKENIHKIARDMVLGLYSWDTKGSGIAFNPDGYLNDGHHTLEACIKSGKTIRMQVILGHKKDACRNCDTGKSRKLADAAYLSGEITKEQQDYVIVVKNVLDIINGKNPTNSSAKKDEFRVDQIASYIRTNEGKLDNVEKKYKSMKKNLQTCNKLEGKVLKPIYYELVYLRGYDENIVADFLFGILGKDTPNIENEIRKETVNNIRKKIAGKDNKVYISKFSPKQIYTFVLNAFAKYYAAKQPVKNLTSGMFEEEAYKDILEPLVSDAPKDELSKVILVNENDYRKAE